MQVQSSGTQAQSCNHKKPSASLSPLFVETYSGSHPFLLTGVFWCAAAGRVKGGGVKLCEIVVLSSLCSRTPLI